MKLDKITRLIPGYDPWATAGDCRFDADAAQLACDFFPECLHHVKGALAGQSLRLEPWEQAIVANLFGWKRPDGTRRYREAFIFVPRKNGKTTLAAGLILLMLFTDREPGAEIYSAAADRDQATLIFGPAKAMVLAEQELSSRAKIYETGKSITFEAQGSSYKAISAEANTKHGYNTHCVVIDELHAQPNRDLVDVLITSTGSRRQPLVLHVTTSDYERESICNEKYDYATKVRDGIIGDPSFLPVIYEASRNDDWTDPKVWARANPNLGVSVSTEYLERECRRAKEVPAYENTFKRLHLNIRTEQQSRWLLMDTWDECGRGVDDPVAWRDRMLEELAGRQCSGGLDLGSTSDLTSLVLLFEEGEETVLLPWFWVPSEGIQRKDHKYRRLYETWIRQGFIATTAGNVADYDHIRLAISGVDSKGNPTGEGIADKYGLYDLGVDRLFQGAQLCTQLIGDGMNVVAFGQGFFSMAAPTKEFEERIIARRIRHGNNPVMRWMAANAAVLTDPAGNIKPVKPANKSPLKIDGIVASIMALGRAMVAEDGTSAMAERGAFLSL